jgi:UDP-glucose 4-epimerase
MKKMRTVLITGGIGYIGSHTAVLLLERDYRVIILDNLYNCKLNVLQKIRSITLREPIFYEGDIRDCYLLKKIFQEYPINSVIHFAGLKAVTESQADPLKYYDYNVSGSISLFRAMLKANVHQLVFSSSATVYGAPGIPQYTEDLPTNPINVYGKNKLMVEKIINDISSSNPKFKAACLRYFNPVGAHVSGLIGEDPLGMPNNLMPYIGQVALGKLPFLKIYGKNYSTPDGTGMRDYIHVEDLAWGHLAALDYIEQNSGVLTVNLGNEKPHSVLEVVHAFEVASGVQIPYQFTDRRAGDLPIYYANAQLAKNILGWSSSHDLQRMCEDSWRFYNKNELSS